MISTLTLSGTLEVKITQKTRTKIRAVLKERNSHDVHNVSLQWILRSAKVCHIKQRNNYDKLKVTSLNLCFISCSYWFFIFFLIKILPNRKGIYKNASLKVISCSKKCVCLCMLKRNSGFLFYNHNNNNKFNIMKWRQCCRNIIMLETTTLIYSQNMTDTYWIQVNLPVIQVSPSHLKK